MKKKRISIMRGEGDNGIASYFSVDIIKAGAAVNELESAGLREFELILQYCYFGDTLENCASYFSLSSAGFRNKLIEAIGLLGKLLKKDSTQYHRPLKEGSRYPFFRERVEFALPEWYPLSSLDIAIERVLHELPFTDSDREIFHQLFVDGVELRPGDVEPHEVTRRFVTAFFSALLKAGVDVSWNQPPFATFGKARFPMLKW
jgi:hypothetical protein